VALVIGLVLVLGAAGFWYLDRSAKAPPSAAPPLTGEARAYVHNLKLNGVQMKAHESYLKQSVVEITGSIQNNGDRILKTVEITCVFYDAYGQVVLRERVPNSDKARFSVHCHNDLGMAVANSLAGVKAGARQIECTINGIGERAGNTALEEVVMAIKTRNDVLPYWTAVDASMLTRASKLVSAATSFPVQYNKAIVGRNAFAHESGIHQDGMLKNAETYEIMTPESVGVKQTSLVMGKHSGRHAFVHKLEELGYELASNQLEDAFVRFKALADRKKQIFDEDIEALVDEEIAHAHDRIKVLSLTVIAGTMGPQSATLTLDIEGVHVTTQSTGNGPVDAIFKAIRELVPHEATLELYQVHAVTGGTDAQAEVSVRLSESGRSFTAKGADPDTLVASAKAYLGALNKLTSKRGKTPSSEGRIHSTEVG
jgi:2-isopropylmalate synthase